MARLNIAVALVAGALMGAMGVGLLGPSAPKLSLSPALAAELTQKPLERADVEAIVNEMLAKELAKQPKLDEATIGPLVESYLVAHPAVLQRASDALKAQQVAQQAEATKATLTNLKPQIYDDKHQVVLGNPKGDVTLVEMFDYNCHYCRQALPDLAALLDGDKNLKVILKEFPILSAESVEAARVAVVVNDMGGDYWAFHQALFTGRGKVGKAEALKAAGDLGLDTKAIAARMGDKYVTDVLNSSYAIAKALDLGGTPTYILGDDVIPGAVGVDELKRKIANLRACGTTECPTGSNS
jgi:protein-disulfide isomerase